MPTSGTAVEQREGVRVAHLAFSPPGNYSGDSIFQEEIKYLLNCLIN